MSQLIRLSSTAAGRELLSHIRLPIPTEVNDLTPLPQHLRDKITVPPFPRNMHSVHNQTRRRARAQALLKAATLHATYVAFVDAAKYVDKPYFAAAAVAPDGTALNALTVETKNACEAEQVAIALALALPQRDTIFTHSKPALDVASSREDGLISRLHPSSPSELTKTAHHEIETLTPAFVPPKKESAIFTCLEFSRTSPQYGRNSAIWASVSAPLLVLGQLLTPVQELIAQGKKNVLSTLSQLS
ncbi:hypothetical protein HPB50_004519 [Hyalomma asiaticum]|uniref:Uncharacterized protein n=1 Tax=Hyalomma asiaticum TaxID=266040 RepID=A0ACB7RUA6_HYAAI|nr:hypothetical protein HPB50_004519 [Hyalomma asiaticum]